MKSANPVKMLVVVALVLLVFSVTEGRIINKCELKARLDAAQLQQITVMEETITVNSLIARLVCKASFSAFNTSFVQNTAVHNEMMPAQYPPQVASQVPPQAPPSGAPPQASPHRGPPKAPSSRVLPQAPAGSPPKVPPSGAPTKVPPSGSPPKVPPSGSPHKVPPSGAPTKVPPFGAPSKVPPSGSPHKVPPFGAPSKVPPSGSPPKVPPSGAPTKVPPSGSPHKVPPSGAPSKIPPSGSPPKVPPSGSPPKVLPSGAQSSSKPHPTTAAKDAGHLYGVFQLRDQLVCDSGMIPSQNVCNMTCSALTDDDITDDITCLKTLTNFMNAKPKEVLFDVKKIAEMMLVEECRSVVPPNYFAECI
ncbi:uncharacterized protein LOC127948563 isoform X1 [Carassius gibelio]|uniref:uncharacterized protein LOC127948563 isoform X1 n=1 Tax=Carassius gibelio TaxID=101364 RepID=UPI002278E561|nr:uncharacterized protein LOC127948563 isoform X1 [Carassius gibelio]